jgi:hypothetical protein
MINNRKSVPLSPEARAAIDRQLGAFRQKFGREPSPTDPIFFDPGADEPMPVSQQTQDEYERATVEAMSRAGIDPALIYAYKKTGRIVTEENKRLLSEEELDEWNDAIDEYHRRVNSGEII